MTGQTISHFKVLEKLGGGGMGVVYLAEDTKLNRIVAMKLLPPHALASEDDRVRFYREARAAAALSHPNIAHIYEIDEAQVEGGESRPFIAMEFIDGETLGDRIVRGPLPIDEAISIATQIADGLKAAHDKDIVHRDIKSGNVMITKSGVVKILDFGLAKTAASTKLTQMGSTLGTVAYMSPEQAKGEEVDRRTDIWSLGVILYEMISGQLPFNGDYEQAVIYAILNEDPESLTALRAGVPMGLDGVVAKSLAKDRGVRYQHVDELPADLKAIDLGSAITRSRISTTSRTAAAPDLVAAARVRTLSLWVVTAAAALVTLVAGFSAAWLLRSPPSNEVRRYTLSLEPIQPEPWPSISADGKVLAFRAASQNQIFVKTPSDFAPQPVQHTAGSRIAIVSPDGRWIAFYRDGTWWRTPVDGSSRPTKMAESPGLTGRADWKTNEVIAISIPGGIVEYDVSSGSTKHLTRPDSGSAHINPSYVGTGNALLFTELRWNNVDSMVVKIFSFTTGETLEIEPRAKMGWYISSGHLLFTEAPITDPPHKWVLMAAPVSAKKLVLTGPAVPVLDGATLSAVAISENGTVAQITGSVAGAATTVPQRLVYVELDETELAFIEPTAHYGRLSFSPDGRRVAVRVGAREMEEGSDSDIWVYDSATGIGTQLTFGGWNAYPVWLPDGNHVAYWSDRDTSRASIWYQIADGSEPAIPLVRTERDLRPAFVHPEGMIVAREEGERRLVLVNPSEGTEEVLLDFDSRVGTPKLSPNGSWMAYYSEETGRGEVFVSAFPPTEARWRISVDGGWSPRWAPDGKSVYFLAGGDKVMMARIETEPTFRRAGVPEVLLVKGRIWSWDIHPDGRRFLMAVQGAAESERSSELRIIENWFEELKRIAPGGG